MIENIKFSRDFDIAFKKLKKRYHSLPDDFKKLLRKLVQEPHEGVLLHDGMRKIRLAIASKGGGKSGGGRVIIRLIKKDTELHFLYIYDKSDMENVSDDFLAQVLWQMDQ